MTTLQPATLSEACRVDKHPLRDRGAAEPRNRGRRPMEGGKNLDSTTEGASGVRGVGWSECC